jgi:RNA polymerase sigma-70 factor, ECF subfamily
MQSDEQLLTAAMAGSKESFATLFQRRQAAIYRFALHMCGSVTIAEDVTQEVFLALLDRRTKFDASRGPLLSFLYGIARNFCLRRIEAVSEDVDQAELASSDDTVEELTRRETIEQVRAAVLELPAVYREAVVLCDLEDLSYQEAATVLDCPLGTVRSRLNRGRALLAKSLSPRLFSGSMKAERSCL